MNKKVIFLLPTLSTGGGERVISDIVLALPQEIDGTIVLFEENISYPYKGNIISLKTPVSANYIYRIYAFFVRWVRFKKIVKKDMPDYVISLGGSANIINLFCSKKAVLRIDNYVSVNNSKGFFGKLNTLAIRLFFKRAFMIMVVSKASGTDLVKNFGAPAEKIRVMYNPVNVEKIISKSKELLDAQTESIFKSPVIISVGSFLPPKGQWHLIRAFSQVKKEISDARLVLVGRGHMEPYLRKLTEDFALTDSIIFLGWQDNPFKFVAKSTVFVLPSVWEGLPCALLETMACGVPVISTDCKSGPREILAPNTDINQEAKNIETAEFGILTPAVDGKKYEAKDSLTASEEFLAKAIVRVLKDKNLANALSQKSKERAGDFNINKIIKEWNFLTE